MASNKQIVTFSFAVESGDDPSEIVQQAHQLLREVTPTNWKQISLTVRNPQYGTEMLQTALTGSN